MSFQCHVDRILQITLMDIALLTKISGLATSEQFALQ
jgi:hypothetical protein